MMKMIHKSHLVSLLALLAVLFGPLGAAFPAANGPAGSYIVQAADMETAAAGVRAVGGELTHELGIIDAVGANLDWCAVGSHRPNARRSRL